MYLKIGLYNLVSYVSYEIVPLSFGSVSAMELGARKFAQVALADAAGDWFSCDMGAVAWASLS